MKRGAPKERGRADMICEFIEDTPVGVVGVVSRGGGSRGREVCAIEIADTRREARAALGERFPGARMAEGPSEAGRQLREYFAGHRRTFDLAPAGECPTEFTGRALAACAMIPFGRTSTYADIAAEAGAAGAARAVGQAMKRNALPIVIPCHRVVAAAGPGGYSAGRGRRTKEALLEFERRLAEEDK